MTTKPPKTKDIRPSENEMIKPGEIIGIEGFENWKLSDRRIWNQLLHNAWGSRLEDPGATFSIPLKDLRVKNNDTTTNISDSLAKLQKTVVYARHRDGTTTQVQMLGGANFTDDERDHGELRYNFNPMLVPILRDSEIYARMELKVLKAMTSKYSLALYEAIALRGRLYKTEEKITVEQLRHMLSVPENKLMRWPDLNRYAIAPALEEVNCHSPYVVTISPIKTGKLISHVHLEWLKKIPGSNEERGAALEVNRHSVGRKVRMRGTAEAIAPRSFAIKKAAADNLQRQGIVWKDWNDLDDAWRNEVGQYKTRPTNLDAHFISYAIKKNIGGTKKDSH